VVGQGRALDRDHPRLAVVVAAHDEPSRGDEWLAALGDQTAHEAIDILIVSACPDGFASVVRAKAPRVRVLTASGAALVPELWEAGIRQSRGDIVALTTVDCLPQPGWIDAILSAHRRPVAAVGGAITCDPRAGVLDWAVYLCRYSPYTQPREGPTAEIAGDNASYKRVAIDACPEPRRDGFWEANVHAALERAGRQLWLDPEIRVVYRNPFGFGAFMRQRFQHGMRFTRGRSGDLPPWERALRVVLWPVVPVLMLVRIVRRVLAQGRHRRRLVLALPVLTLFLSAWALGEAVGYARGRAR
jgi:hypothetical protein